MNNKRYRGLVLVTPAHLNPAAESDRYNFSGFALPSRQLCQWSFRVIPLPGGPSPEHFAAVVAAQKNLAADAELFAPLYDLGRLTYHCSATGRFETVELDDAEDGAASDTQTPIQTIRPKREHETDSRRHTGEEDEPQRNSPEPPTPDLEF